MLDGMVNMMDRENFNPFKLKKNNFQQIKIITFTFVRQNVVMYVQK